MPKDHEPFNAYSELYDRTFAVLILAGYREHEAAALAAWRVLERLRERITATVKISTPDDERTTL